MDTSKEKPSKITTMKYILILIISLQMLGCSNQAPEDNRDPSRIFRIGDFVVMKLDGRRGQVFMEYDPIFGMMRVRFAKRDGSGYELIEVNESEVNHE